MLDMHFRLQPYVLTVMISISFGLVKTTATAKHKKPINTAL